MTLVLTLGINTRVIVPSPPPVVQEVMLLMSKLCDLKSSKSTEWTHMAPLQWCKKFRLRFPDPILDASGQTNHISIHIWSLHFPQIDLHSPLISKQQPTRRPTGLLHPTNLCDIRDSCMAFLQLGYICVGLDVCSLFTGSSISGINGSRRNSQL